MKRYEGVFARAFRPFFPFTGAGTMLVGLSAILPAWAMDDVVKLRYLQDYTITIQPWGIMVGVMGAFMLATAIVPAWRMSSALCSATDALVHPSGAMQ